MRDIPRKYQINGKRPKQNQKGRIADGVDNYKNQADDETRRFTIGYEFYREDLCEIISHQASPLRKSIENYKKFCKCSALSQIREAGIHSGPIDNAGTYKHFFKGLPEDVEMKEFYTGEHARGIYFIDPTKKVVQIVAHLNTHTPLNKQFR